MEGQGRHLILGALVEPGGIHVEAARSLTIWSSCEVVGRRPSGLRHDLQGHGRYLAEELRQLLGDPLDEISISCKEILFRSVEERRVLLDAICELGERALEAQHVQDLVLEATFDPDDLLKTQVVHLLGGLARRGVEAQALGVDLCTIAERFASRIFPYPVGVELFDEVQESSEGALEAILDGLVDLRHQLRAQLPALQRRLHLGKVTLDELLQARGNPPHHGLRSGHATHASSVGKQVLVSLDLPGKGHQPIKVLLHVILCLKEHPL
mmetsp:Transcript_11939/g.32721  ORF Transcript_11939/g.32721 Transcript_11939/m.32721 type:complete len:268 (-) Transcript_11939:401-1204(-)